MSRNPLRIPEYPDEFPYVHVPCLGECRKLMQETGLLDSLANHVEKCMTKPTFDCDINETEKKFSDCPICLLHRLICALEKKRKDGQIREGCHVICKMM